MSKDSQVQPVWHNLGVDAIFRILRSNTKGLSAKQAAERLKTNGFNVLPAAKRVSSFIIFLNQFKSPLIYVMLFALGVSLVLNKLIDAGVIFFIVAINVFLGWLEEKKADDAITKLKQIIVYQAKILRDGRQKLLDTKEIVIGDVVFLRSGDRVPADCRFLSGENLQANEALLTGESTPVDKNSRLIDVGVPLAERSNMLYMGTDIVRGSGWGIVVATGKKTEMGKIGVLLEKTEEKNTSLQEQLKKLSFSLSILVVFLCFFILGLGLWAGYNVTYMLLTSSSLAVAAIPEGLLIALTIVLALGMQRILKQKSLVRKLAAAETLGSVSIILTDKTGTLTEGRMQVAKFFSADQEFSVHASAKLEAGQLEKEHDLMLKISLLCSSAKIENPDDALSELKIIGDPTESALLRAGVEAGFDKDEIDGIYPKIAELPFDSEKKFMASLHHHRVDGHYHVFAKGAPEKILSFCDRFYLQEKQHELSASWRRKILLKVEEMAEAGLRVIALAYKTGPKFSTDLNQETSKLVFIGLIGLKDPLRPEAKSAIEECGRAGIRPVVVTGDHPLTAKAIFAELGLNSGRRIITGADLDKLPDSELDKKIDRLDIYARVEPHHKLRLVQAWQRREAVTAMTGDGINDAPALKAADIGIALGSGSDVAKETADIILLDNNFQTIVHSVREGRIIFDNIRKITFYLLSGSFSEVILIAGSLFLGLPLPLTALQILWINLMDHGLPSLALTLERQEDDVMKYAPRRRGEPILNRDVKIMLFFIVAVTDLALLLIFIILNKTGFDLDHARTLIFAISCFDSLLYVLSIRSLRHLAINRRMFSNKYLNLSIIASLFLILPTLYPPLGNLIFKTVPLSVQEWLFLAIITFGKLAAIEIGKYFLVIRKNKFAGKYAEQVVG